LRDIDLHWFLLENADINRWWQWLTIGWIEVSPSPQEIHPFKIEVALQEALGHPGFMFPKSSGIEYVHVILDLFYK
jgi:hypothetical protein